MITEWLEHIAIEGDRWDTLAYRYYGDANLFPALVEANPHLPIGPYLPAGKVVVIPLREPPAPDDDADLLPPWKR